MSYLALARKWRPRSFAELLGQETLTHALTQALAQDRVHHAYLFTGTRGVGKTSVARILAKALNCEQGISATPCLSCDACLSIEQGRFIDLIEIDAASKTRVEDTRELLDNVQYAPSQGRFKIYLIDEVHMLSQHSFNALLKTLEEPPAHVKFLLATTDPQKLPVTILSRCLQFNLKHVPDAIISKHLQHIIEDEQIGYEPAALPLIAKAARGSMRDALSLLDQAIAGRSADLTTAEVAALLGCTTEDFAIQLLQALADHQPQQLISISRQIAQTSSHFRYVLDELLGYLHRIAISHALPNNPLFIESDPSIAAFSQQFSAEDTQLFYQIGLKGLNELSLAPTMAMGFEMTLLRMYTFRPADPQTPPKLVYQTQDSTPTPAITPPVVTAKAEQAPLVQTDTPLQSWADIIPALKLSGLALSAIKHSELLEKNPGQVILKAEKAHQSIFTAPVIARIKDSLSEFYNESLHLSFEFHDVLLTSPAKQKKISDLKKQEEATTALMSDPVFQQIQTEFSANLVKDSISEVKDSI